MTPKQRGRRDQRKANLKPIRITSRDLEVIHLVYQARALTTQQIQTLFFPSLHRAYERLADLYHHGFLERLFLGEYTDMMNSPLLYVIDKPGVDLLRAELGLDITWEAKHKQVGTPFLRHLLAINDVRVAVTKACQEDDRITLGQWRGGAEMKDDYAHVRIRHPHRQGERAPVVPDSYFYLDTPRGQTHFFLELDRGTMELKRFVIKVKAYTAYYESGAYQKRYNTKSLRVLTVATSQRRADNLKKATDDAGGKQRFWFTALEHITPDKVFFKPIWQLAGRDDLGPLIDLDPTD